MPRYPAVKVQQNKYFFYSAVVPGKLLMASSFVSRREEDPTQGFNRTLSRARAIDIARYLDRGLSIPTNIIVSAQAGKSFTYDHQHIEWKEQQRGVFLVIDGQHRLFSMEHASRDFDFVVAIYDGLSPQDEVQLFIDINTNQKGVPTALLLDIKKLAGTETDTEEQLRRLFDQVADDSQSPLFGRFSAAATKPGAISRVTFNGALKNPMTAGVLTTIATAEDQGKLVVNYLIAADRIITASGARRNDLTKATILQAFFEVFNEVTEFTLARSGKLKPEDLAETMQPLIDLDFDGYVGSNRPSKAKLVADMRSAMISPPAVTPDML